MQVQGQWRNCSEDPTIIEYTLLTVYLGSENLSKRVHVGIVI